MVKQIVENVIWIKAQDLIQEKYGKQIKFKTLGLTQISDAYFTKGDDLIIPLQSKSKHLGEVVVTSGSQLTVQQKKEVLELIQFLVKPHIYNEHLALAQFNEKCKDIADSNNNVYQLFEQAADVSEKSSHRLISQTVHLTSQSAILRHKVAMKLHEMSEQNYFLNWSQFTSHISKPQELLGLDHATFYVEDIMKLSTKDMSLLLETHALKNHNFVFIIGSHLSDSDIKNLPLTESLRQDLLNICFDIDRVPVSQLTSPDVLELLFFNLDK